MKKNLLVLACLAGCLSLGAQEKVKEVVTDSYDRNGLSVIVVNRGDSYDYQTTNFINQLVVDEKFDANAISVKSVSLNKDRSVAITQEEADSLIKCNNIAKEVLGFIYNRKADGSMDDELLRYRGQYNAKDQDVINSAAAKVNEQHLEWGEKLIASSYVILIDFVDIHQPESSDGKKSDSYMCDAYTYAYKMDCSREKLDEFYMTSWANANDNAEAKAAAVKGFEALDLNMVPVASVKTGSSNLTSTLGSLGTSFKGLGASMKAAASSLKATKTDDSEDVATAEAETVAENVTPTFPDNSVEKAEYDAYTAAIVKLENQIPAWQVAVSIISTKPLKAKIGKKEGVSNGKRFRAYSYTEDKDGNLVSKKRGYLRATKVSDNRGVSTGATEPSEFYQISGVANIQEGWTIKQKNDIKLGAALTGKVGGLGSIDAGLDFDYLIHISKIGSIYAMFNIGTDVMLYGQKAYDHSFINLNASAGVGYGLHVGRFVEIAPYIMAGADMMKLNEDVTFTYLTEEQNKKTYAIFVEPGLRASFQVAYPLSLFVKAGYDLLLNADQSATYYNEINVTLPENRKHKSGVFGEIGVRWAF